MRPWTFYMAVITIVLLAGSSKADLINWIDFSQYPPGSFAQTGLTSSDGLEMNVVFSNTSNMRSGYPLPSVVEIDDPAWPFENLDVSDLIVISRHGYILTTQLSLSFTNPGGLPAGGSIGIIDLEDPGSKVVLAGYRDGEAVNVSWSTSFYQTAAEYVPDAIWDPQTSTLYGSIPIENAYPSSNNFSFLVTDCQLDSVVLTITAVNSDGIGFAASATEVPTPDQVRIVECQTTVQFDFWVGNTDSLLSIDAFRLSSPRAMFVGGTPPDTSVTIESCNIVDTSMVHLPPPAPGRWCRTVGGKQAWWFFEPVPPMEPAPFMAIAFSIPSNVTPDEEGLQQVWYDVDYALLSGAVAVLSGTFRFHCEPSYPTGVRDDSSEPIHYGSVMLRQPNCPNPFNPRTSIRYSLARPGPVSMQIYDIRGRLVRSLLTEILPAGEGSVEWDGSGEGGEPLASGVYIVRLRSGAGEASRKVTLVR